MKKKEDISCPEKLDILEKIIEDAPFSLQIYTPEGLCIYCNKAWEKLWKSKRELAIGRYNLLKDPQLEQRHIAHFYSRAFKGKQVFLPAVPYISPEKIKALVGKPLAEFLEKNQLKRTYVDVWLYPIKDKSGKIVRGVIVHQNVTKRRKQESEMLVYTERLESEVKRLKEVVKFNEFEIDKLKRIKGLK
ncbi:MAG: hypothetical protein AAB626_00040 [Patescibacteria group bacterium]